MSWFQALPFARKEPAPRTRAERRRVVKLERRVYMTCRNCGYGALKGIKFSNLVAVPLANGTLAYQHITPVVCSGILKNLRDARALTIQAWIRANLRGLTRRWA